MIPRRRGRHVAARRFGVSIASAVRWVDAYLRAGRTEAQADLLLGAIEETPDITLAELRARLIAERGETSRCISRDLI